MTLLIILVGVNLIAMEKAPRELAATSGRSSQPKTSGSLSWFGWTLGRLWRPFLEEGIQRAVTPSRSGLVINKACNRPFFRLQSFCLLAGGWGASRAAFVKL